MGKFLLGMLAAFAAIGLYLLVDATGQWHNFLVFVLGMSAANILHGIGRIKS